MSFFLGTIPPSSRKVLVTAPQVACRDIEMVSQRPSEVKIATTVFVLELGVSSRNGSTFKSNDEFPITFVVEMRTFSHSNTDPWSPIAMVGNTTLYALACCKSFVIFGNFNG